MSIESLSRNPETSNWTTQLTLLHFAAVGDSDALPLVLLHGWGSDSRIFDTFIERLRQQRPVIAVDLPGFGASGPWPDVSMALILDALAGQLPERFDLLGWSLGGMIATAFTAEFPQRVNKLITLACNATFVVREQWPAAMPAAVYEQFCDFFAAAPADCLKQFCGLQSKGDLQQRQLIKQLRNILPDTSGADWPPNDNWRQWLALMGEIDNRNLLAGLECPTLHLFGAKDSLVPVMAAEYLARLKPDHRVGVLPDIAHCLHHTAQDAVCAHINNFLAPPLPMSSTEFSNSAFLDKRQISQSFSRAAASYDSAAEFQRTIADQLILRLPHPINPRHILDVGSGTGYLSAAARQKFPNTALTAIDIAPGMLGYAQQQRPVASHWLCGDAEALPLADACIDLVLSNLAYQWCERPQVWGAELRRILKPHGVAIFSTFGANTLHELRGAWRQVDDFIHVNRFVDINVLQKQLSASGLHCELTRECHVLTYSDLKALMRELKALGAHNVNHGRNSALTGRQRLQKLTVAYEQFRNSDGKLPATYEVIYGVVKTA